LLARALLIVNQPVEAIDVINKTLIGIDSTEERFSEAEIYRIKGEATLAIDAENIVQAEEYFKKSLEVAHSQKAKLWELRSSMSLARLWLGQGKITDASELVSETYGWFTEGFDFPDLIEAKSLIDELASQL
jgi:predicted ATPase